MPRQIGLLTKAEKKFDEFSAQLQRYGIECVWLDSPDDLSGQIEALGLLGILQEHTELWSLTHNKRIRGEPEDFDAVRHTSHVYFHALQDGELTTTTYTNTTEGTINLSLGVVPLPEDCYHWDMIFVVDRCGLSLYQIKQQTGRKISSRDLGIAQFFKQHIHYAKNRDLVHSPQHMKTVVDFDEGRVVKALCGLVEKGSSFIKFPLTVLNQGVFLRAARSRRSFLYWCPGLNAGLPLVPKPKDAMHEKTFMFHDMIHFLMPDLVFDGDTSSRAKICYVAYRLSSELISLVVADMLYVAQSNAPYPTVAERRIFPLYQAFGDAPDTARVLAGAFRYGFFSDDSIWREMIAEAGGDVAVLGAFRDKYDNYILQDFRWTLRNWSWMTKYEGAFRRWWDDYGGFTTGVESISGFIERGGLGEVHDRDELLSRIFGMAQAQVLSILERPTPQLDVAKGMHNAIGNYLVGQARIFYHYDFLPQTDYYHRQLREALGKGARRPAIEKLRALYRKYLAVLVECRLIDPDDEDLYQETYPIFDAGIVDYRERPDLDPLAALELDETPL